MQRFKLGNRFVALGGTLVLFGISGCVERISGSPNLRQALSSQRTSDDAANSTSARLGQRAALERSTDLAAKAAFDSTSSATPISSPPSLAYSQTDCSFGPACGQTQVSRQFSNWLAYASTTTNQNGWALTVNSVGILTKGWDIPIIIRLNCASANVRSCADAQPFGHTCSSQDNYISLQSVHSAILSQDIFVGATSDSDDCVYEYSGGSGGSGTQCFTEFVILEIWDGLNWQYLSTEAVTTCV